MNKLQELLKDIETDEFFKDLTEGAFTHVGKHLDEKGREKLVESLKKKLYEKIERTTGIIKED